VKAALARASRPLTITVPDLPLLGDYGVRWAVIAAAATLAAGWMAALGVRFDEASLYPTLAFSGLLVACIGLYRLLAMCLPRLGGVVAVVNDLLLSLVQLLALISAFLPLTYLAVTIGFPLVDAKLAMLDATLFGFDWDAYSLWVAAHPLLDTAMKQAYGTIFWQGAAVLLIGSLAHTGERNSEALWLLAISLILTIAVFCFTPALGKLGRAGDGQIIAVEAIRGGHWARFSYDGAAGIISFPSFHATLAVILTYCARRQRLVLALLVPLNLFMGAAIPVVGGHYLIDIPGGVAIAAISILLVQRMRGEPVGLRRKVPAAARAAAD
jgi:hypothetical protein